MTASTQAHAPAGRGIPLLPREAREVGSLPYQLAFLAALLFLVGAFLGGFVTFWKVWKRPPGIMIDNHRLGEEMFRQKQLDRAAREFESAVAIDPYDLVSLMRMGHAFSMMGNPDAEIEAYRRYLERMPASPEAHNLMAKTLIQHGDFEGAASHSRDALQLRPEWVEPHLNLAAIGFMTRDYAGAEREFREALRLNPAFHSAHLGLGLALSHQGRLEEAEACFAEAVRLQPDDQKAQLLLKQTRQFLQARNPQGDVALP